MRLAVALLVILAGSHIGYELIALSYDDHEAAAKAWFYMLRGIEGVALFGIIAARSKVGAVIAVCALGMAYEGATTICRASKPIGSVLGYAPFGSICGPQWDAIGYAAFAVVALGIAYEIGRSRRGKTGP